jgi:hypothetical protein
MREVVGSSPTATTIPFTTPLIGFLQRKISPGRTRVTTQCVGYGWPESRAWGFRGTLAVGLVRNVGNRGNSAIQRALGCRMLAARPPWTKMRRRARFVRFCGLDWLDLSTGCCWVRASSLRQTAVSACSHNSKISISASAPVLPRPMANPNRQKSCKIARDVIDDSGTIQFAAHYTRSHLRSWFNRRSRVPWSKRLKAECFRTNIFAD